MWLLQNIFPAIFHSWKFRKIWRYNLSRHRNGTSRSFGVATNPIPLKEPPLLMDPLSVEHANFLRWDIEWMVIRDFCVKRKLILPHLQFTNPSFGYKLPLLSKQISKGGEIILPPATIAIHRYPVLPLTIYVLGQALMQGQDKATRHLKNESLKRLCQAGQALLLSQIFHSGVREGNFPQDDEGLMRAFHKSDKILTLVGDLQLVDMYSELACVGNNEAVSLMSDALSTFCEQSFPTSNSFSNMTSPFLPKTSRSMEEFPRNGRLKGSPVEVLFTNVFNATAELCGLEGHLGNSLREDLQKTVRDVGRSYNAYLQTQFGVHLPQGGEKDRNYIEPKKSKTLNSAFLEFIELMLQFLNQKNK